MRKFLIATHRSMSAGMLDTIKFFTGSNKQISILEAYLEDTEIHSDTISQYMEIADEDELIILTDIASGSVTQKFYPFLRKDNVFMVSGINLPLALSLVLSDKKKFEATDIDCLVEEAREQIQQIHYEKSKALVEDE